MKLPSGVSGLTNAMDTCGWTYAVTPGIGQMDVQAFGPPRGDGTRPKLTVAAPVESIAVRAVHPATGRQVRALFVCRLDKAKRAWTMTTAWRGRHDGEYTPHELTATEVRAYVAELGELITDEAAA